MLQNLHTHTNLCDGKNTPEEMIEKAIQLGFDSIGFSAHAKTSYNTTWEIRCTPDEYISKIRSLKKLYEGKIKIFAGAELDYFSKGVMPTENLDYTIGSVHMVQRCAKTVDFDHSYEASKKAIDELYRSNSIEYSRDYYEMVMRMSDEVDYDIVGHFDLLTKFSEKHPDLIDLSSNEYKTLALEALHTVRKKHEFFEINTGAISRGHRTTPYPAPFILDEMKTLKCKLLLTSDCHEKNAISCNFPEAKEYIKSHGFDTLYYLGENGFYGKKI